MFLTERFAEALALAARLHAKQVRKGGDIPYVSHLLAVTALVLEYGGDEDQAIAAALHDAVEDQGGPATAAVIGERFGPRVAALVAACSDTDVEPKPPWRKRKEDHLAEMAHAPAGTMLILAADKLHNARSVLRDYREIGAALWKRFGGGRDGTLWYLRSVRETLRGKIPPAMEADLEETLDDLETLVREQETPGM
ncbi:MAG: HD domain-containing protein [Pirellulales bacterium]